MTLSKTATEKTASNSKLNIRANERVFLAGKTGSGKTTLAEYLLLPHDRLVVVDDKDGLQSWGLEDYKESKHIAAINENQAVRIRVMGNDVIRVLQAVYKTGNCIVFIDEINATIPPQSKPDQVFIDLWQRGRSRGIGAWGGSQRPTSIPLFFLSESEHFFIFRLNLEADRKRVAQFAGKQVLTPPVDRYGFYYYDLNEDKLRYFRQLNLK